MSEPQPANQLSPAEQVLKASLSYPDPFDVKFFLFNTRKQVAKSQDTWVTRVGEPRGVLAASAVLKQVDYFRGCKYAFHLTVSFQMTRSLHIQSFPAIFRNPTSEYPSMLSSQRTRVLTQMNSNMNQTVIWKTTQMHLFFSLLLKSLPAMMMQAVLPRSQSLHQPFKLLRNKVGSHFIFELDDRHSHSRMMNAVAPAPPTSNGNCRQIIVKDVAYRT